MVLRSLLLSDSRLVNSFSETIDLMLSETTEDIPTADEIIAHPLLLNQLTHALKFIEEVTLKSTLERKEFFR